MLCDKCLLEVAIPKLREDDIAILQYLYNNSLVLPQTSIHINNISDAIKISIHKVFNSINRLECFDLVIKVNWQKSYRYYLSDLGSKSLNLLLKRMEEF